MINKERNCAKKKNPFYPICSNYYSNIPILVVNK